MNKSSRLTGQDCFTDVPKFNSISQFVYDFKSLISKFNIEYSFDVSSCAVSSCGMSSWGVLSCGVSSCGCVELCVSSRGHEELCRVEFCMSNCDCVELHPVETTVCRIK